MSIEKAGRRRYEGRMTAPRFPIGSRRQFLPLLAALCAVALPPCSFGAGSLYPEFVARLSGHTVLNASPDALAKAVREQVQATPHAAPQTVRLVLASGRADDFKIAPAIVAAAIEALGAKPAPVAVGRIVAAAVNATPTEVLQIVKSAVHAAPGQANANAIIAAATQSVPDAGAKITVRDHASHDHKAVNDGKARRSATDPEGTTIAIRDAIVQAALEADPSLDRAQLVAAAIPSSGIYATGVGGPDQSDPSINKFELVSRLGGNSRGVAAPSIPQVGPVDAKPVSP